MNTIQLLERFKAYFRLNSDYQAAQKLGIPPQTIGRWRKGGTVDDLYAVKMAELLNLNVGAVLAEIHAERSKCPAAAAALRALARKAVAALAPVFLGVFFAMAPVDRVQAGAFWDLPGYTLCAVLKRSNRRKVAKTGRARSILKKMADNITKRAGDWIGSCIRNDDTAADEHKKI